MSPEDWDVAATSLVAPRQLSRTRGSGSAETPVHNGLGQSHLAWRWVIGEGDDNPPAGYDRGSHEGSRIPNINWLQYCGIKCEAALVFVSDSMISTQLSVSAFRSRQVVTFPFCMSKYVAGTARNSGRRL